MIFLRRSKIYFNLHVYDSSVKSFGILLVFMARVCINIVFSINYEPQPYQTLREAAEICPA